MKWRKSRNAEPTVPATSRSNTVIAPGLLISASSMDQIANKMVDLRNEYD